MNNIYIFSNVHGDVKLLNIAKTDILIFLNDAVQYYKYKDIDCKKFLVRRWMVSLNKYAGNLIEDIETLYLFGKKNFLLNEQIQYINNLYDYNFKTPWKQKQPTTGWICYNIFKRRYKDYNVKLVNFFPNTDFSTSHCQCHNWKFQDEFYKKNNVEIIDLRMNSKKYLYKQLYCMNKNYGSDSFRFYNLVNKIVKQNNFSSIIDFGCGNATLHQQFKKRCNKIQFYNYDFAIQKYSKYPQNKYFDFLVCLDVMQHIPEKQLEFVIKQHLKLSNCCLYNISCRKAINILPNGENAHCTVRSKSWWLEYLKSFYDFVEQLNHKNDQITVLCKNNIR